MTTDLVELGFCVKPHGIRGEFSFFLYNKDESVIKKGSTITIYPKEKGSTVDAQGQLVKVASIRVGNKVIARLENVENRNDVEAMIPFTIHIGRDEFPALEDEEYYISDMINAEVFDHQSGEKIGIVKNVYDNGFQDIFEIATSDFGLVDVLNIPNFVQLIDPESNRLEVTLPEVISERN
ncbi:MAG: 16S rRNA processing protein RimM [Bacteriovoracaceae bacterium]|nr:16S rRNA processing protein RimM [Bacteriovoracaceae bacterium]